MAGRSWMAVGAWVVVVSPALAACAHAGDDQGTVGSSNDATTRAPADDLSTLDGFCRAVARAACSDAVVKACHVSSVDGCMKTRAASCKAAVPQGTTYVPDKAPACIALVAPAHAAAKLVGDDVRRMHSACEEAVFSGPGEARSRCSSPFDCASRDGLACLIPLGAAEGRCLVPHDATLGQPCGGEADRCEPSAFCEDKTKTCQVRRGEGMACHVTLLPCDSGLVCPLPSPFAMNVCRARKAGEPCSLSTECGAGLCDKPKGHAQGNCVDVIDLAPLDEACVAFVGGSN